MQAGTVTERLQVQADWLTAVVSSAQEADVLAAVDPTELVNLLGSAAQLVQVTALLAALAAQRLTEIAAEALAP